MRFFLWLMSSVLFGLMCQCSFAETDAGSDVGAVSAPEAASTDARLEQRVTYEARHVAVWQIVEDLAAITGIQLYSGTNRSDWPVRSRKMNIFVKDVKMSDLMDSIARSMKFVWRRNDKTDPATYRLLADSRAVMAANAQVAQAERQMEELWRGRRDAWIDVIRQHGAVSSAQLDSLRETDPIVYEYVRRGAVEAIGALFTEVPETEGRYAAGQSFRISADKLSAETRRLLFESGNEFWKYLQLARKQEPVGYGDTLKPDDKVDIACGRLDVGGFSPNLRWGAPSIGCTGYFHISKGERDFEIAGLPSMDSDWDRFRSVAHNQILDGIDPGQAWGSGYPSSKLWEARNKEEEAIYPSEPLNEHSSIDELEGMINLKVEIPKAELSPALALNTYIASFQEAIAEATGFGIVSDSWTNIYGEKLSDQEATLGELLDKFSTQFNYNWDKNSTILEFRHRKWWKNRLNQVSDDQLAVWRENTRKNGILSLDDLAQISCLTYYQAEESLKPDQVLGLSGIYKQMVNILDTNNNMHWLWLYSSLSSRQRAHLTDTWITGAMFSSDQWELAQIMYDRIGSSRSDAVFSLRTLPNDKEEVAYEFRVYEVDAQDGSERVEEDRKWIITLPRYVRPATQENVKH